MTTFEQLLLALNGGNAPTLPEPAKPLGGPLPVSTRGPLPGPMLTGPPDLPPIAPMPAQDRAFIDSYSGPAPTPPRPASRLERIFAAIGGVGAGLRGEGAQYLEALRAPQREYEARRERFEERRGRAIELDERRRERRQEIETRQAERVADREFQTYLQRSGISDKLAIETMQEAHENAKQRERERAADERLFHQQRLEFAKDLAGQIKFYKSQGVGNHTQARRLALNDYRDYAEQLGIQVPELLRGDDAVLARVGASVARLNRLSGGADAIGGGARLRAAQKASADFEATRNAAIAAAARGDTKAEGMYRRKLDSQLKRLGQFSDLIESGYGQGGWPYQKAVGQQPQAFAQPGAQPQQGGPVITMQQLQVLAQTENPPISVEEAARRATAAGYKVVQ